MASDSFSQISPVLRLPKVREATGLSRSTLLRRVKEGTFPAPIKIGPRAVGWVQSQVLSWINDRIKASRPNNKSAVGRK